MKRFRGFSLLEVLVAVAVIGIALSAALNAMSRSVDNLSVLERKTLASWVAENQLAYLRIEVMRNLQNPSKLEGEEEMAGRIWYWKATIETTEDDSVNRVAMMVSSDSKFLSIDSEVTSYLPVVVGQ